MKELVPNKKSELVPFAQAVQEALDKTDLDSGHISNGCIFESGKFAYICKGSLLEVVNIKSGLQCSACDFSLVNQNVVVTCVISCKSKFIVGLRCNGAGNLGMLCVYDPGVSRIVKAIKLQAVPISIVLIREFGGVSYETSLLSTALRCMFGIVAVGTEDGHVLLIDMRADDDNVEDTTLTTTPSSLLFINASSAGNAPQIRDKARSCGQHCCLDVTRDFVTSVCYKYSAPGGVLKMCDNNDCSITCLLYLKQSVSLVVGFSFGAFQVWSLGSLEIIHSSSIPPGSSPVSHLAYQEPENDPRNCVFLWVGRGPLPSQTECLNPTSITLYQVVYGTKEFIQGYGALYKQLGLVVKRFDHQLTADVHHLVDSTSVGSRIISFNTLDSTDSTVCIIVWETPLTDTNMNMSCHLGIFDLNCYYEKQLPRSVREAMYGKMEAICPFFAFYLLTDIAEDFLPVGILDVYLDVKSIDWFRTSVPPQIEQFSWPSSASFKLTCLSEMGTIEVEMLGMQKQIISDMIKMGPDSFLDIGNLIQACCVAGLLHNSFGGIKENEDNLHTDALLSIALDHGGMIFITSCIKKWSHGSITHAGHSLKLLHDWAWSQVVQRKRFLDGLHFFLFDSVEEGLDDGQLNQLKKISIQLRDLSEILNELKNSKASSLDEGIQELEMKSQVTLHLAMYADILLLLVDCLLLPEQSSSIETCKTTYNAKLLSDYYQVHRATVGNEDSLFIDVMWKSMDFPETLKEENNDVVLYPPASVEVMCSLFVHNMPNDEKKSCIIFYYWFLDICECYMQLHSKNAESKFKQFMKLSNSEELLVKSTWLLDHKLYNEALTHLLMVDVKISSVYYHHIVKLLYKQGEKDLLALFFANKRPNDSCSFEQMKFLIYVMLQMGKLSNAYELQSNFLNASKKRSLFNYFIEQCIKNQLLQRLMMLPIIPEEENILHNYLLTSKGNEDYLLVYYLERGLFTEASKLTKSLKAVSALKLDQVNQDHLQTQCLLANGFSQIIPHIQQRRTDTLEKSSNSPSFKSPLSSLLIKGEQGGINMSHNSLFTSGYEKDSFNNLFTNPAARRRKSPLFDAEPICSKKQKEMDISIANVEMSPEVSHKRSSSHDSNPLSLLTTPASAKRSYSKISVGNLKQPQSILKMKPFIQQNMDSIENPISSGKRIRFVDSRSPGVPSSMDGSFLDIGDKVELSFISNSSFASATEGTKDDEEIIMKEAVDDKTPSLLNEDILGSSRGPECESSNDTSLESKSMEIENILNDLEDLDQGQIENSSKSRRLSLHAEENINVILKSKYVLNTKQEDDSAVRNDEITSDGVQTPPVAEQAEGRSLLLTKLAATRDSTGNISRPAGDNEDNTDIQENIKPNEIKTSDGEIVEDALDVNVGLVVTDDQNIEPDSSSTTSSSDSIDGVEENVEPISTTNDKSALLTVNEDVLVVSSDNNDTHENMDSFVSIDNDEVISKNKEFARSDDNEEDAEPVKTYEDLYEKRDFVISDDDDEYAEEKDDADDIYGNMDITPGSNDESTSETIESDNDTPENIDSFVSANDLHEMSTYVDDNEGFPPLDKQTFDAMQKHEVATKLSGSIFHKEFGSPAINAVEMLKKLVPTETYTEEISDDSREYTENYYGDYTEPPGEHKKVECEIDANIKNDEVEEDTVESCSPITVFRSDLDDEMEDIDPQDDTCEFPGASAATPEKSPHVTSVDDKDGNKSVTEDVDVSMGVSEKDEDISAVDPVKKNEEEENVCMEYKRDNQSSVGNLIDENVPTDDVEMGENTSEVGDQLYGDGEYDYSDDAAVADGDNVINIDDDDDDDDDVDTDDDERDEDDETDDDDTDDDDDDDDDDDSEDSEDDDDGRVHDYGDHKKDGDIHVPAPAVSVVVLDDDDDDNKDDSGDNDGSCDDEEEEDQEGKDDSSETEESDIEEGEQDGVVVDYIKHDVDIDQKEEEIPIADKQDDDITSIFHQGQVKSVERTEPIPIGVSPERNVEGSEDGILECVEGNKQNVMSSEECSQNTDFVKLVDEHTKDKEVKNDGENFVPISACEIDIKSISGDMSEIETMKDVCHEDDLSALESLGETMDEHIETETIKEISDEDTFVQRESSEEIFGEGTSINREAVLDDEMEGIVSLDDPSVFPGASEKYLHVATVDDDDEVLEKDDNTVIDDVASDTSCTHILPVPVPLEKDDDIPTVDSVERNDEEESVCIEYKTDNKSSLENVMEKRSVVPTDDVDMEINTSEGDDHLVMSSMKDLAAEEEMSVDVMKEGADNKLHIGIKQVENEIILEETDKTVSMEDDNSDVIHKSEKSIILTDVCDINLPIVSEQHLDIGQYSKHVESTSNITKNVESESMVNIVTSDNPELVQKMEEMDVKKEAGNMEWQHNLEGFDSRPKMSPGRSPVFLPTKVADVGESHSEKSSEDNGSVITPVRTLRRRTVYRRDHLTPRTNKFRIKNNSESGGQEDVENICEQDVQVCDSDAQVYLERYNTAKVIQQNKGDNESRTTRQSTRLSTSESKGDSSASNSEVNRGEDARKRQGEGNAKYFIIDDDDQSSSEDIEIESDDLEIYLGLKRKNVGRPKGHAKGKDMSPIKEETRSYEPEEENIEEYTDKEFIFKNVSPLHIETSEGAANIFGAQEDRYISTEISEEQMVQGPEESSDDSDESEDDEEPTKRVTRSQQRSAARLTRSQTKMDTDKSSPIKNVTGKRRSNTSVNKSPEKTNVEPKKVEPKLPLEIKHYEDIDKEISAHSSHIGSVSNTDVPTAKEEDRCIISTDITEEQMGQGTEESSNDSDESDDDEQPTKRVTRSQQKSAARLTRSQAKMETVNSSPVKSSPVKSSPVKSSPIKKATVKRRLKASVNKSPLKTNKVEASIVEPLLEIKQYENVGKENSSAHSNVGSVSSSDVSDDDEEVLPPRITRSSRNLFSNQSHNKLTIHPEEQLINNDNNAHNTSNEISSENIELNTKLFNKKIHSHEESKIDEDEIKYNLSHSTSRRKKRLGKSLLSTRKNSRNSSSQVDKSSIVSNIISDSSQRENTINKSGSRLKESQHLSDTLSSSSALFTSYPETNEMTDDNSTVHSVDGSRDETLSETVDHDESSDNTSPVRQLKSYPTRHGDKNKSLLEISLEASPKKTSEKPKPKKVGRPSKKSLLEIKASSSEITDKKEKPKPKKLGRPSNKTILEIEASSEIDKPKSIKGRASKGRGRGVAQNLRKRNAKT